MTSSVPTIRRWTALACALALAAGGLAACGGDDGNDTSGSSDGGSATQTSGGGTTAGGGGVASTVLAESAVETGGLAFSRSDLTARAGRVTMTLDNPSSNALPHAIEVEGNGVEEETETIDPGARASVTVDLRPGRYTFYCPVDSHRAQGMEGTLTVS